jgi:hypothetical protein
VTQASEAKPILALILKLDMASVREILSQEEFRVFSASLRS